MDEPPLIDLAPLIDARVLPTAAQLRVAEALDAACRSYGFFRVTGHGIDPARFADLDRLARRFFAQSDADKARIAMAKAGPAWRGWFPVGAELTSGQPDRKEGIYFGTELPDDDPRVVAGTPLHGPNLFPDEPAGLGSAVLAYLDAATRVGHAIMSGLAIALGLPGNWFADGLTADPTVLFRIFHYPPEDGPRLDTPSPDTPRRTTPRSDIAADDDPQGHQPPGADRHGSATTSAWGVGEHTDYGLLTLLAQDDRSGLEVRVDERWVPVPAEPGVLVCNLGDMLEALTAGRYRSTLHRVRNTSGAGRLSFPLFFDPGWDARVRPLPLDLAAPPSRDDPTHSPDHSGSVSTPAAHRRWDRTDPAAWTGTYGEYLTAKVSRVFPELFASLDA